MTAAGVGAGGAFSGAKIGDDAQAVNPTQSVSQTGRNSRAVLLELFRRAICMDCILLELLDVTQRPRRRRLGGLNTTP